jgi:hypothetical protein
MCRESLRRLELLALLTTEAEPTDFSSGSSQADEREVFNEDAGIKERGLLVDDCRAAGLSWGRYPGLLGGRLLVEEGLMGWFFLFEQVVTIAGVF